LRSTGRKLALPPHRATLDGDRPDGPERRMRGTGLLRPVMVAAIKAAATIQDLNIGTAFKTPDRSSFIVDLPLHIFPSKIASSFCAVAELRSYQELHAVAALTAMLCRKLMIS
jgi:hypothetical protein